MFVLKKVENGRINVAEPEYYPVGTTDITQGEALVLSSGKLVACGSTAKPSFIAVRDADGGSASVPVFPVTPEQIYEADASTSLTEAVVGTKVTLASGSTSVTATTTNGVATLLQVISSLKALVKFE